MTRVRRSDELVGVASPTPSVRSHPVADLTDDPAVDSADDHDVVRPSLAAYKRDFRKRAAILGPFVAFVVLRPILSADSVAEATIVGALVIGTAALCIGGLWVHMSSSVVRLEPGRLVHGGALVRDRAYDVGHLQGVLAPLVQPMTHATTYLVLHDTAHDRTMRLSEGIWDAADLGRIAAHAGVTRTDDPMTPKEVEARIPGSMPFHLRHPLLLGTFLGIVILAVAVGGVIGWFMWRDLPPWDDPPPREVSAETIAFQDQIVTATQGTLGGRWVLVEDDLDECELDGTKGWRRSVDVARLDGRAVGAAEADVLVPQLEALDFEWIDVSTGGGSLSISTATPGGDDSTSLDLLGYEDGQMRLWVRGPCEIP